MHHQVVCRNNFYLKKTIHKWRHATEMARNLETFKFCYAIFHSIFTTKRINFYSPMSYSGWQKTGQVQYWGNYIASRFRHLYGTKCPKSELISQDHLWYNNFFLCMKWSRLALKVGWLKIASSFWRSCNSALPAKLCPDFRHPLYLDWAQACFV